MGEPLFFWFKDVFGTNIYRKDFLHNMKEVSFNGYESSKKNARVSAVKKEPDSPSASTNGDVTERVPILSNGGATVDDFTNHSKASQGFASAIIPDRLGFGKVLE